MEKGTIDHHSQVPVSLALRLEGEAIMAKVSTEEYLEELLDKFGHKVYKAQRNEKLREYIKKRNSQGATDTQIAREKDVSQQLITRHRKSLGLAKVPRPYQKPWNKGGASARL